MEKIASNFHEKNMCQNDAGKLQAELVKSVTDLNIKAESLKSDLQAQQSGECTRKVHKHKTKNQPFCSQGLPLFGCKI